MSMRPTKIVFHQKFFLEKPHRTFERANRQPNITQQAQSTSQRVESIAYKTSIDMESKPEKRSSTKRTHSSPPPTANVKQSKKDKLR